MEHKVIYYNNSEYGINATQEINGNCVVIGQRQNRIVTDKKTILEIAEALKHTEHTDWLDWFINLMDEEVK